MVRPTALGMPVLLLSGLCGLMAACPTGGTVSVDLAPTDGAVVDGAGVWGDGPPPGDLAGAGFSPTGLRAARRFPSGPSSQALAVADLDGDGRLDVTVARADSQDPRLSLLQGDGEGGLKAATTLRAGDTPFAVAAVDLDGDQRADLVSANYLGRSISLYANQGAARFAAMQELPAGAHPISLAVADLDGDGRPDLACANQVGDSVSVFLNSALGFTTFREIPVGPRPSAVVTATLTSSDAAPSLLLSATGSGAASPAALWVLRARGGGAFAASVSYPIPAAATDIAVGDLTGDGIPDVVLAHLQQDLVSVLPGDGRGGFGAARTFAVPGGPAALALVDLDRDGALDIVVAEAGAGAAAVLRGLPGTLAAPVSFPACQGPTDIAVGDLDRDQWPDLILACAGEDAVAVLRSVPAR